MMSENEEQKQDHAAPAEDTASEDTGSEDTGAEDTGSEDAGDEGEESSENE